MQIPDLALERKSSQREFGLDHVCEVDVDPFVWITGVCGTEASEEMSGKWNDRSCMVERESTTSEVVNLSTLQIEWCR